MGLFQSFLAGIEPVLIWVGRRISVVSPLPKPPMADPGLSVASDGSWLYYSIDDSRSYDIMLIGNFQ